MRFHEESTMLQSMRVSAVLVLAGVALSGCAPQAGRMKDSEKMVPRETGFLARTVSWGGQVYRYVVYVPADYDPGKAWPTLLFLHGAGERGDDGTKQAEVGIGKAIRENPSRYPCIVVMPQCRHGLRWDGPMLDMAQAALAAVEHDYRVDPNRVVLTGLSLGGYGTWTLGAQKPQRFAALGPVCGWGEPAQAAILAKLPIWCWHGEADPAVPVQRSRDMVTAVKAAGGTVRYSELPGVGHNSWDAAYGDPEFAAWLVSQKKK
jgi:predicted peptidase